MRLAVGGWAGGHTAATSTSSSELGCISECVGAQTERASLTRHSTPPHSTRTSTSSHPPLIQCSDAFTLMVLLPQISLSLSLCLSVSLPGSSKELSSSDVMPPPFRLSEPETPRQRTRSIGAGHKVTALRIKIISISTDRLLVLI